MIDLNNHKLELEYPCEWEYKVVIKSETDINPITKEIFETREHSVKKSKQSSKGKFCSYNIKLTVESDEDRTGIYKILHAHEHIKMVV
jgi:uncharacterized protein